MTTTAKPYEGDNAIVCTCGERMKQAEFEAHYASHSEDSE